MTISWNDIKVRMEGMAVQMAMFLQVWLAATELRVVRSTCWMRSKDMRFRVAFV